MVETAVHDLGELGLDIGESDLDSVSRAYGEAHKNKNDQPVPDSADIYEQYYDAEVEGFFEFVEFNELENCDPDEVDEQDREFDEEGMPIEPDFTEIIYKRLGIDVNEVIPPELMATVMTDYGFQLLSVREVLMILDQLQFTYATERGVTNHAQYDVFGRPVTGFYRV